MSDLLCAKCHGSERDRIPYSEDGPHVESILSSPKRPYINLSQYVPPSINAPCVSACTDASIRMEASDVRVCMRARACFVIHTQRECKRGGDSLDDIICVFDQSSCLARDIEGIGLVLAEERSGIRRGSGESQTLRC